MGSCDLLQGWWGHQAIKAIGLHNIDWLIRAELLRKGIAEERTPIPLPMQEEEWSIRPCGLHCHNTLALVEAFRGVSRSDRSDGLLRYSLLGHRVLAA